MNKNTIQNKRWDFVQNASHDILYRVSPVNVLRERQMISYAFWIWIWLEIRSLLIEDGVLNTIHTFLTARKFLDVVVVTELIWLCIIGGKRLTEVIQLFYPYHSSFFKMVRFSNDGFQKCLRFLLSLKLLTVCIRITLLRTVAQNHASCSSASW